MRVVLEQAAVLLGLDKVMDLLVSKTPEWN